MQPQLPLRIVRSNGVVRVGPLQQQADDQLSKAALALAKKYDEIAALSPSAADTVDCVADAYLDNLLNDTNRSGA
jgi:hypothetical protein